MQAELLAPAGSWDSLEAALKAGADAVYLGGSLFGARAYADNLSTEKLMEAIDLCHLHGRKLYLTVNTLLKEAELSSMLYQYLAPLYETGWMRSSYRILVSFLLSAGNSQSFHFMPAPR